MNLFSGFGITSHLANGQESPLVFKLDTGTNANALKVNLVCDEDEKEELLYQNIELPGLLLGNKSFNPGSFYLFDLNFGDEVHGILGYPFFEKHVVLLDFPNRAVYLKEL